ncbi:hypothetical protein GGR54DRAFT_110478 [Hypoxylon sp. NC1633]|nr:hypothetical protein GGR54DRAFT_110478 [Hypoxylon sp. NC1633]
MNTTTTDRQAPPEGTDSIQPVKAENVHEPLDPVKDMKLKTAAEAEGPEKRVVMQVPPKVDPMRPENYVVRPENLGEQPDYVDCWHCEQRRKTTVRYQSSTQTQLAALVCCLCCGIITVFIPFCCHWCSNTEHVCEKCHSLIATKPHEGKMEAFVPPPKDLLGNKPSKPVDTSIYTPMNEETQRKADPELVN